jgi:hypothetical protein
LGFALLWQGSFAEAAAATQEALGLLPAGHPLRAGAERQQKQCQQFLALEKRLPLVLENKINAGPDEFLALARMCYTYKKRHATAVLHYQKAFNAQPALADDEAKLYRYHAACAAALAGLGQGDEAANLTKEEKIKLRRQARDWLQADLSRYVAELKNGKVEVIMKVEKQLSHWQADAELGGVRDAKALAAFPDEEQKAWQKLWADVAGSLKEGRSRSTEIRVQAELTETEKSKVHEWNLVAGRTYVIDLESTAFDTLLKLQDPKGKLLAENDDIVPGVNLNSQLIFTPPVDGVYGIVATSFQQEGAGPYTLRIREFKDAK